MSDEQAERVFLDSVNPADPGRRDWAARFLNLPRVPGMLIPEYYAKWHALLEEAAPGEADKLEQTWPLRLCFAERLLNYLSPSPRGVNNILWHPDGTVAHMSNFLSKVAFEARACGYVEADWKRGCWFCKKFVDLCPPSSHVHPRDSCPLMFHPLKLRERVLSMVVIVVDDLWSKE
ncbi:hypothetical protein H9P43_000314 [Blastocladiella emersonii ATCC 22665]|nr:hypothetical protein H9P43_000314 [Blastocladiella emersonii ATCC 22665]